MPTRNFNSNKRSGSKCSRKKMTFTQASKRKAAQQYWQFRLSKQDSNRTRLKELVNQLAYQ